MSNDATQKIVNELREALAAERAAAYAQLDSEDFEECIEATDSALAALEAAQRPPVGPEQREALDELIADVLIAERDEWPRDPGDAPSEVLAGAVTDAILARFSLPTLDTDNLRAEK